VVGAVCDHTQVETTSTLTAVVRISESDLLVLMVLFCFTILANA
jgi:hypothetical protein